MTEERYQALLAKCQPHPIFKLDWTSYYSIDFANTFLPNVNGFKGKAFYFFDGAELLTNLVKVPKAIIELSKDDSLESIIAYSYPKIAEAAKKRDRVSPAEHEVCIFLEVSIDDKIDIFFKFGDKFQKHLINKGENPIALSNKSYKSTIVDFDKHFENKSTHHLMMHFILKTLNMEEEFENEIDRKIEDNIGETNATITHKNGMGLMHINHQFINVGESIAQIKYNTSATVTNRGTVIVNQIKQEISSRGEEVWYYKNSIGKFEGTLSEAKLTFPNVDFSELKLPQETVINHPEFGNIPVWPASKPLEWETLNEFDAQENGGKPTTWDAYLDATQTALDIAGLVPGFGEIADCLNGVISLTRGDYTGAALSFAAMVPVLGAGAAAAKYAKKVSDNKAVYDLVVKNATDVKGYVGQSENFITRIKNHFSKNGKLNGYSKINETIHKMPGSSKREREIYEQFVILKKYGEDWKEIGQLLNQRNPVGGKFDLLNPSGKEKFYKEANEVIKKYGLPIDFN